MTSNLGGMETFICLIYSALKGKWEIDFLTVDKKIPFEEKFVENGAHIHKITPRYVSLRQYKKDIKSVFEHNKYDVLWFNKTTLSAVDVIKEAKKHSAKVICHSHQSKNMGTALTQVLHMIHRISIGRYVDHKVACSENAARYFFGTNIDDVTIFSNAVNISKFEPNEEVRRIKRKELGADGKFVITNIARFSIEKNHKFLLEIFRETCKSENAILLLCGVGSLLEKMKDYAEQLGIMEKVRFLGVRNDIPDILQATDVIVFPSLFEGLPFALVEAQAAGVPCIVSDTISSEIKITDLIHFKSLEDSVQEWTKEILKYKGYTKISMRSQLEEKGFSDDVVKKEICELVE